MKWYFCIFTAFKMDKSRLSLPLAEWAALNGHYNSTSSGLFGGGSSSNGSNSNGSHSDDPPSVPEGEVAATPCTPGDPMTHYHHKNEEHFCAAFARINRMRIHSQVRLQLPTSMWYNSGTIQCHW